MSVRLVIPLLLLAGLSFSGEEQRSVADAGWESIFFREIDRVATNTGIMTLRQKPPMADEIQLRVWAGFGLSPLQGLVIERAGGIWRGRYVCEGGGQNGQAALNPRELKPSRPWPQVWEQVDKLGVLALPDESQLKPDGVAVLDGICYVVEVRTSGVYRTYMYNNPGSHKWPEAAKLSQVVMFLGRAFAIPLYAPPSVFPDIVKDGQVVFARKGRAWGAFQILHQHPSGSGEEEGATVNWIYRTDGKSVLNGAGVSKGQLKATSLAPFVFGPFSVRWSVCSDGKGYIYYPDARGTQVGQPDREYLAMTDIETTNNLDAADAKWEYRASYVDLPDEK
jgi:hypothetical protein